MMANTNSHKTRNLNHGTSEEPKSNEHDAKVTEHKAQNDPTTWGILSCSSISTVGKSSSDEDDSVLSKCMDTRNPMTFFREARRHHFQPHARQTHHVRKSLLWSLWQTLELLFRRILQLLRRPAESSGRRSRAEGADSRGKGNGGMRELSNRAMTSWSKDWRTR